MIKAFVGLGSNNRVVVRVIGEQQRGVDAIVG